MTGHGGARAYFAAPARTMVPLPEELSFEEGAAVSCGTGTAWGALRRLDVSGRDTLAVFGQGPVGLTATMLGAAMGARVIAVDISPDRLALARDLGAEATVDAKDADPVAAIRTSPTARARRPRSTAPATRAASRPCARPPRGARRASSARAAR